MYAELGENQNGSKSFDASLPIEESSNDQTLKGIKTIGKKPIKKNSDLRKSLIDDGHGNGIDLEAGNGNGIGVGSPRNKGKSSIMSDDDPYYVFKEDLLIKLELVADGLERYELLVRNTVSLFIALHTALYKELFEQACNSMHASIYLLFIRKDTAVNTAEVKDSKKQLKRHLKNAESTLKDLQTTVRMVEKKRSQFTDINDAELYERKNFTASCTDRIKQAKDGMNSQGIKTKLLKDERSKSKRRLGLSSTRSDDSTNEETHFIENNHASAQLMMEQQDETLDDLDVAVIRVGHMAENIHEELGQQNKMLDELGDDLENAEEQLGMVMGKMAKMLKTKSKWQLGTIVALSLIVVVLFLLVIYT